MSPAASPLIRFPVGVVVERRKAASPWIDFTWHATAVLPDEPDMRPWTMLREEDEVTTYYVGGASIDLYRSETAHYLSNLDSGLAGVWVVMSATDGDPPYRIDAVTVDPAEGEGFSGASTYLVEQVPMPEAIRETVARFVAEHHVEREFTKRKRDRADPEALARRDIGEHDE